MPTKGELKADQMETENLIVERINELISAEVGTKEYKLMCGQIIAATRKLQRISYEIYKLNMALAEAQEESK